MKQVFQAIDGKVFESAIACLQHEGDVALAEEQQVTRVLECPKIQDQIKFYGRNSIKYWELKGESPDAYAPGQIIGIYHGPLIAVVREAAKEKKFFSYGGGGEINPINVKELT